MSDKMECPGCGSYSSTILGAFERGERCPTCGLHPSATREILAARKRAADADLTAKYERLVKQHDKTQRELAIANATSIRLDALRLTVVS